MLNAIEGSAKSSDRAADAGSGRTGGHQGQTARDLGVGRLRHHRHDAADRRRVAVRSGRPARRLEGAGRRGRQRQLLARSGPPLVRGHVHRLRPGAARGRPPPRRGRAASRSRSRRPTPRRCRSRTDRSTSCCRRSASCSRPITSGRPANSCASAARRTHRPGELDTAADSSGGCSRSSAAMCRRRRRSRRRRAGERRSISISCSRASASYIHTTRRDFVFRYRSAEHWIDVFRTWYGPVHKAFASSAAGVAARLEQDLIDLIDEFNSSGDSTMVVPSEYLEVVIVKR